MIALVLALSHFPKNIAITTIPIANRLIYIHIYWKCKEKNPITVIIYHHGTFKEEGMYYLIIYNY